MSVCSCDYKFRRRKSYHVCRKLTSSSVVGTDMWEQVRFRHDTLVSLVCLQGQMSTMLLGLILIGYVIYLCFQPILCHCCDKNVPEVINIVLPMAVLWGIKIPSIVLENSMSEMYTIMTARVNSTICVDAPISMMSMATIIAKILQRFYTNCIYFITPAKQVCMLTHWGCKNMIGV